MKFSELTHRTGLQRGRLFNGSGGDMTEYPRGAGNRSVGTFCMDFSGLMPRLQAIISGEDEYPVGLVAGENEQPLINAITGSPTIDNDRIVFSAGNINNINVHDNEFTWVIADGRGLLHNETADENDIPAAEGARVEWDDGAVVTSNTEGVTVHEVTATIMGNVPTWWNAGVWVTSEETGDIETLAYTGNNPMAALAFQGQLGNVLDVFYNSLTENILAGEGNWWTTFAHNLRWTLHWALAVVKCGPPDDEGLADWSTENQSDLAIPANPIPMGGPFGFQLAYGGDTNQAMRLWMPHSNGGATRIVARGQRVMRYMNAGPSLKASVNGNVYQDLDALDADVPEVTIQDVMDSDESFAGANWVLRLKLKRTIKLRDDEIIILVVQSGRARLARFPDRNEEPDPRDLIIAGPNLLDGRNGPSFSLLHHEVHVTGERW